MLAKSLEVQSREINTFTATKQSDEVSISGSYDITIKNTSEIPVPAVFVYVKEVTPTESDVSIISESQKQIGRMSSDQTTTLSFSFSLKSDDSSISDFTDTVCNNQEVDVEVQELYGGIVFRTPVDKQVTVNAVVDSCSLSESDPGENEDSDDSEDQIGIMYAVEVDGPDSLDVGESGTWEAIPIETTNNSVYYNFDLADGTSETIGQNSTESSVTHSYSTADNYEILVTMYDSGTEVPLATELHPVNVT